MSDRTEQFAFNSGSNQIRNDRSHKMVGNADGSLNKRDFIEEDLMLERASANRDLRAMLVSQKEKLLKISGRSEQDEELLQQLMKDLFPKRNEGVE